MGSQTSSPAWRVALFMFIFAATFWIGGSHIRAIVGSQLLKFGTLEFSEYVTLDAQREIFRILSFSSLTVIGGYLTALVSSVVFLASAPFKLKENGWLLMSAILFYMFVPVEAYVMYLDAQMAYFEFFTTVDDSVFRELFVKRVAALSGAPLIATFCYYTIIGLAVFQPMRRPAESAA